MYKLCNNIRSRFYLKVRDMMVRLISFLLDSNRNSAREFVRVSGNWLADKLTCSTSPYDVGWYSIFFNLLLFFYLPTYCYLLNVTVIFNTTLTVFFVGIDTRRFRQDPSVIHTRDFYFVIRFEVFVHFDGQLRASHLILSYTPAYTSFQDPSQMLTVSSPLLSYLDVWLRGFLPRGLTLGEAQALGPWHIREGSLLPVRDGLADTMF